MPSISIRVVDPQGADALALLREAAADARALYAELFTVVGREPTNEPLSFGGTYLIAFEGSLPMGCGALRRIDDATVEVRRMYVLKSARRNGLARSILAVLETEAIRMRYRTILLETGDRQTPAMALYESCGFKRTAAFGGHVGDPTSVCYAKRLL